MLRYSQQMGRRLLCVALAVALPTASVGSAQAQDDRVFVDPEGPTAREYAIPLDAERRRADGSARGNVDVPRSDPVPGGVDAGSPAPRFGQGVTPAVARSQEAAGAQRSSDPDGTQAGRKHSAGAGLPAVARLERQESSPTVTMLTLAALILGLGLAGGLIRRRQSPRS